MKGKMYKVSWLGKHQLYDDDKPEDKFFKHIEQAKKEQDKWEDSEYYWCSIEEVLCE